MDLVFDICMFIFMTVIIFVQHFTIVKFDERIRKLAEEIGIRQQQGRSQRSVLNNKLRKMEKQQRYRSRSRKEKPTYMRGELQLHRDGQTAVCDATFKPKDIR
ncbi:MAG: hypothetical protein VXZ58_02450 [Actinomycetota bacterium]|nr:hypothetical protein [Actinomycetota bacterium]|tara:strand:- start:203 stop:511 length:309 start_codon:yes stop_codon:yes gene_type:complete